MKKKIMFVVGFLLILLTASSWADVPGFMKAKMGTLKGTVYVKNKTLANAVVAFFDKNGGPPPVMGSARRVPEVTGRANDQGEFSVKLLPGTYYMGCLIRDASIGAGPPRPGEEYFFIRDEQGKLREFTVETKLVADAGRVDGLPPGAFQELKDFITIKGKITDEQGKPLAGALVTLKESMEAPRPRYISEGTAADGTFTMKVPPGKYYVVGRESIQGGKPSIGSYIGSYGKTSPTDVIVPPNAGSQPGASAAALGMQGSGGGQALAIEGKAGAVIDNVNIQMFKIPDPGETRAKFEAQAERASGVVMPVAPPAAPAEGQKPPAPTGLKIQK